MADDRSGQFCGIEWEITVAQNGFLAPSLEQPALEQNLMTVDFNQVHGASGCTRGSKEVNPHGGDSEDLWTELTGLTELG